MMEMLSARNLSHCSSDWMLKTTAAILSEKLASLCRRVEQFPSELIQRIS
jgi:hypothetical protein